MNHNHVADIFGVSKGDLEHDYSYIIIDKENKEVGQLFLYQNHIVLRSGNIFSVGKMKRLYL